MEIRRATDDDIEGIREVARASMRASYGHALDEGILDEAVERWYDAEGLGKDLADDDAVFVVAVDDGRVIGFAQSYVTNRRESVGEIDWLHVSPDRRGRGVGERLFERVEAELLDRGVARLEGRVLEENESGAEFYEQEGFERVGERAVEIGGESFVERIYATVPESGRERAEESPEAAVEVEERTTPGGETVFVAYEESVRGAEGPFYATYVDADRTKRHGWFCGRDESFDLAMDTMDRLVCNSCGNKSKPSRWDDSYL